MEDIFQTSPRLRCCRSSGRNSVVWREYKARALHHHKPIRNVQFSNFTCSRLLFTKYGILIIPRDFPFPSPWRRRKQDSWSHCLRSICGLNDRDFNKPFVFYIQYYLYQTLLVILVLACLFRCVYRQ